MGKVRVTYQPNTSQPKPLTAHQRLSFHHDGPHRVIHGMFLLLILMTVPQQGVCQGRFIQGEMVDAAVNAEMKRQNIVGIAIGIIQDAQVIYTKGYGCSDIKSHTPVTDDTIFNWASNSKPLMSIAALQLVQNGDLNLDKAIVSYCPNLPDQLQPITTRQLLCHQSGIPHYSNGTVISSREAANKAGKSYLLDELDPIESISRFTLSPLRFEPGSQTGYSSYAYVLLSAVVQAAGNEPISAQLEDRIINPLNLTSFQLDLHANQQANWTRAYEILDGKPAEVPDSPHFWKHGAGGYKSNVKDFAKFATALANSTLIDQAMSTAMWTRQTTADGKESSYGLGVVVSNSGNSLKISHNGSQDETRTRMVVYPNRRHGIVVMCNTQGSQPAKITTAIYSALRNLNDALPD